MVMRMPNSTLDRSTEKRKSAVRRADLPAVEMADTQRGAAEQPTEAAAAGAPTADTSADVTEEKCPVIRANRIIFSSATAGRLKVVFF
jgi:hypothetical protein